MPNAIPLAEVATEAESVSARLREMQADLSSDRTTEASDSSEIIVPNAKQISERLVNWTLSRRQPSIEVPVAVAQDSDPNRVIKLLERTAAAHPLLINDPPPRALVVKLGPDALDFELRAWTDRIEQWMLIHCELAITISATLTAKKIAIR